MTLCIWLFIYVSVSGCLHPFFRSYSFLIAAHALIAPFNSTQTHAQAHPNARRFLEGAGRTVQSTDSLAFMFMAMVRQGAFRAA